MLLFIKSHIPEEKTVIELQNSFFYPFCKSSIEKYIQNKKNENDGQNIIECIKKIYSDLVLNKNNISIPKISFTKIDLRKDISELYQKLYYG